MKQQRPQVLLALSPLVEQMIAPLLFGEKAVVSISGSIVEFNGLERALNQTDQADALLLSADLPDLNIPLLSQARTRGLRLIGIATDNHEAALLQELPLDTTLTQPITAEALKTALTSYPWTETDPLKSNVPDRGQGHRREKTREGTVLATVGSRGASGATELACSLAAVAATQWHTLLVELDLLGGAPLALRLGADPAQGSLLALIRATSHGEAAIAELLDRWLVTRPGWPPVLLAPAQPADVIAELDQPGAIRTALDALANHYALVTVDVGSLLTHPGELGAVERCHREALLTADAVILTLGSRENQLDTGLAQLDLLLTELGIPPERLRVVCTGLNGPGAIPRTQLEQTLTLALRERQLAPDALLPWDNRALSKATRTGLPLAAARPRGPYAHAISHLLETLFLPGSNRTRHRKRLLTLPATPAPTTEPTAVKREQDEVVLPWRN